MHHRFFCGFGIYGIRVARGALLRRRRMSDLELLKPAEVALRLRVCPRTVRELVRRGELRAIRIGRSIRIDAASVAAILTIQK